ncbi:MAG TPA: cyclase family protein [Gemmatimonadales bacterium]|nr:cyclase family protein [Gemmatimonadales bacterium]
MDATEVLRATLGRRVYDLEQPRTAGMPIHPAHRPGYLYHLHRRHRDGYDPGHEGPRSGASGTLVMMEHTGTHIDALSHQACDLTLYGGIEVTPQVETSRGFTAHGIETMAPIVTRGVLLDVCAVRGQHPLPPHYRITAADLDAAATLAGVTVRPRDALLVRTGYGTLWHDEARYLAAAGVGRDGSLWAADHEVACVGCDNMTWDEIEERDPESGATLFAHLHLLARCGIPIIENLALEELSGDRCFEFLFVCLPLKFVGATGSPVRPVAIA